MHFDFMIVILGGRPPKSKPHVATRSEGTLTGCEKSLESESLTGRPKQCIRFGEGF